MGRFSQALSRVQQKVRAKEQYDAMQKEEKAKAELEGLKREQEILAEQKKVADTRQQIQKTKQEIRNARVGGMASYFKGMGIAVNKKPQSPFAPNMRKGGGIGPSYMMLPSHLRPKVVPPKPKTEAAKPKKHRRHRKHRRKK